MSELKETCRLVLYHKNCMDGYAAAYAAWLFFGDARTSYQPIQHGDPVPDNIRGLDVYLLDFSFKKHEMLQMLATAIQVTVIDHHKSAEAELAGLFNEGLVGRFDMEKSGAVLAHEYFFPGNRVPDLLHIIQDRDLWQYNNPNTKFVTNYLWSIHDEFKDKFSAFRALVNDYQINPDDFIGSGKILENFRRQQIEGIKKHAQMINGIPIVNCPHGIHSEVIGELSVGRSFAVGFYVSHDKIIINLRSDNTDKAAADVSLIAAACGGGGHENAAGFILKTNPKAGLFFDVWNLIDQSIGESRFQYDNKKI